ncbi:MAG: segregation/condensation protein A [Planctomycetes bacterium]|nr:segregation/condensation protein A [Planctomycetota bacterium]
MTHTAEDYRVELDCYSGPLDLLLFLVRRHEIDLNDILVARLTEQYLEHLKLIQQIDFDLAGEFLVMAASLLEVKSAMLVPRPEGEEAALDQPTETNPLDPRYELVQQLLAYKRFKDAANGLEARRQEWEQRFMRAPAARTDARPVLTGEEEDIARPVEIDLEDVHVLDLCEAFSRILETIGVNAAHQVVYDDTPIALHAEDILDRLTRDGSMTLQQIFVGRSNRSEMIGLFLATLELVRQRRVKVTQDRVAGEISLQLRPASEQTTSGDDKPADWRDPATGQMQYDWPSEEARLRAERRAKLRASWMARRKAGDTTPVPEEIIDVDEVEAAGEDEKDGEEVERS